jgi:hypothetical protein
MDRLATFGHHPVVYTLQGVWPSPQLDLDLAQSKIICIRSSGIYNTTIQFGLDATSYFLATPICGREVDLHHPVIHSPIPDTSSLAPSFRVLAPHRLPTSAVDVNPEYRWHACVQRMTERLFRAKGSFAMHLLPGTPIGISSCHRLKFAARTDPCSKRDQPIWLRL